ncbi:MAG: NfeD family protein [Caulobacteraceae bacterium]
MFLVIEIMTGSGWMLWPAGSAVIAALASTVASVSALDELMFFAGATIVTTYLGRRFLVRARPRGADINDPHPRLIGHRGEANAAFRAGAGRVLVDGKEWAAELDGDGPIAAGDKVEVTGVVGGARLKVRPA